PLSLHDALPISGSTLSATSPPIIPPDPRPVRREARVASRARAEAARPRGVSAVGVRAVGAAPDEAGPTFARELMAGILCSAGPAVRDAPAPGGPRQGR